MVCGIWNSAMLSLINCKRNANLNLWATNPADSRQLTLQQQVVSLIIKAPLTDSESRTSIFHLETHKTNYEYNVKD